MQQYPNQNIPLSAEDLDKFIATIKNRFEQNRQRHIDIEWEKIEAKLRYKPDKIAVLYLMEQTGGQPDVIEYNKNKNVYIFYDCSPQSPESRRSLCYDHLAWQARKENKPISSATDMAAAIGINLLTEQQYRHLQTFGDFDTKTSSWIQTPPSIRNLKGALFCDCRYDTVFVYHNGAESYYAGRGFRGSLEV